MQNILLIRLKAIGDVIFTLPAVSALREKFPDARITFLASRENAGLLRGFPDVNDIIALDRAALRGGNPLRALRELFGLLRRLRGGRFSLVVDFQGFGETAWMAWLTGAMQRWGTVYGNGRSWAYTHGQIRDDTLHPADWNLQLLARCGVECRTAKNQFTPPPDARAAAEKFLADHSIDRAGPILVIQPLTSTPQKNWPLENFIAVARHWRERGVAVVFLGGPRDAVALGPALADKFCVATDLPLLVSAAVVQFATLTLGGDSGLGHLAVAQGRRVLMLMMHQNPGACIPYGHPDWVIVPDKSTRIHDITVAAVIAEAEKALQTARTSGPA